MSPEALQPADRTPTDVASLLKRPFAPNVVKQRKIAGRDVDYISIDDVIDRLNRACLTWDWDVVRIEVITLPLKRNGSWTEVQVVHTTGTLTIPGLGSRTGIGTAPVDNEDAAKAAASDALKKAGSLFGIPTGNR